MSEDREPEEIAADERAAREGFNPILLVALIVLLGVVAYVLFARFA